MARWFNIDYKAKIRPDSETLGSASSLLDMDMMQLDNSKYDFSKQGVRPACS